MRLFATVTPGMGRSPSAVRAQTTLRTLFVFIVTMLFAASHPHLHAQQVPTQAPPAGNSSLPDDPSAGLPFATVIHSAGDTSDAFIDSGPQTHAGDLWTADDNVVFTYRDHVLQADHIEYNQVTGDITAIGHVLLIGGARAERISASHGTYNIQTETGRFYDVQGSVGMRTTGTGAATRTLYVSDNPFLFAGRLVVKTGPRNYDVYGGWFTSCRLPSPDWRLFGDHFSIDSEKARGYNAIFRLINVPLLYLPYVTHPVDAGSRQSGLLIPVLSESSSKGFIIGEAVYLAINRSTDLTVGAQYYSSRGWEQSATFRYRGLGYNSFNMHYSGLLDRGYTPAGGVYTNQGGEDATLRARHDFDPATRAVADIEYLSNYVYREAFSGNFNQAVSSDVVSTAYLIHQWDGFSADVRADRYQGLKQVPVPATATAPAIAGEQVRVIHAPSFDFTAVDHSIAASHFLWNLDASATGLKRSQPNFVTSGVVERFDLHPQVAYPLSFGGWHFLPSLALRETMYSRSRVTPYPPGSPVESTNGVNRSDVEMQVDIRPPVIERTFSTPRLARFLGVELKHTIEPSIVYRNVRGIDNFPSILRFDDIDIVSDTDELQYGVTQYLFGRSSKTVPCVATGNTFVPPTAIAAAGEPSVEDGAIPPEIPAATDASPTTAPEAAAGVMGTAPDAPTRTGGAHAAGKTCTPPQKEWASWRLTQKYFFDPNFGGAIIVNRRNIFDTTLDLSGIAFLTEPRNISPLVSRLRVRTTDHVDVGWDFDLDTGAKRFLADNVFLDAHKDIVIRQHEQNVFAGLSYARLNAPGRFYTDGLPSSVSDFSQLRLLLGFGQPTKPGLSVAANTGLDLNLASLQYGALQASYNWDCCGLSIEYRKFELGSVRNEGVYRFNFTLANIASAGNLRRAERLF